MHYTITITEQIESEDIRTLLEEEWLVPRKVRHFLRVRKNVLINDEPALFHDKITSGDKVTLIFEEDDYATPAVEYGDKKLVTILFEDEHLLVVNKPSGMKTHPNQPKENHTLLNHVADYLHEQNCFPYVVHRLDKETSGAILFAKNPFVLPILGRMLEKREVHRTYQGLASGQIKKSQFTIDKKIGRDRHDRRKRIIDEQRGQEAITHVTVDKVHSSKTEITCELETGRTHQIRVHLASIGHPLIGDPLYHPHPEQVSRLMLHAKSLELLHPFTKEKICILSKQKIF